MPLPSSINDLSTTAASNSPAGTEASGTTDDYLRTHASYIAALRDVVMSGTSSLTTLNLAYTGTLTGGTGVVNLGSGQFYKDSSGNVGIGTSSPGTKLDVYAASGSVESRVFAAASAAAVVSLCNLDRYWQLSVQSGGSFLLYDSTAAASRMAVDSSGNVGIGTSSPGAKLEVKGITKVGEGVASNTSKLMVNTLSGVAAGIQLFQDANESWIIQNPASSTALTFANSGTERMRIDGAGNVGIGTASPTSGFKVDVYNGPNNFIGVRSAATSSAGIEFAANGNTLGSAGFTVYQDSASAAYVLNRSNTAMLFGTNNIERMRIDSSGNVGIGDTPDATFKLDIYKTSNNYLRIRSDATSSAAIYLSGNGNSAGTSGAYFMQAASNNVLLVNEANAALQLGTNGTERMRIDASGNVGIGVASPAAKLDVAGDLRIGNTSAPATPSSGGVLYVESGALKYKGSSGTVTTLGAA